MILDQLKQIDLSHIADANLKKQIETALQSYENKDNLLPEEITAYEKIYARAQTYLQKKQDAEQKQRDEQAKAAAREQEEKKKQQQLEKQKSDNKKRLDAITFPHLRYIEDNKINISTLPLSLKNAVKLFNASTIRFMEKGTVKLLDGLQKQSEKIKTKLVEFVEKETAPAAPVQSTPAAHPATPPPAAKPAPEPVKTDADDFFGLY